MRGRCGGRSSQLVTIGPIENALYVIVQYTNLPPGGTVMLRAHTLVGAMIGLTLLATTVAAAPKTTKPKQQQTIELKNAKDESVGTVTLTKASKGVILNLNLSNLPPGEHAIHIHQNAKCEANPSAPQDAFKSAGGHFNPDGKKHGLKNPEGPHAGDMTDF